jgi:hypothetical protein
MDTCDLHEPAARAYFKNEMITVGCVERRVVKADLIFHPMTQFIRGREASRRRAVVHVIALIMRYNPWSPGSYNIVADFAEFLHRFMQIYSRGMHKIAFLFREVFLGMTGYSKKVPTALGVLDNTVVVDVMAMGLWLKEWPPRTGDCWSE